MGAPRGELGSGASYDRCGGSLGSRGTQGGLLGAPLGYSRARVWLPLTPVPRPPSNDEMEEGRATSEGEFDVGDPKKEVRRWGAGVGGHKSLGAGLWGDPGGRQGSQGGGCGGFGESWVMSEGVGVTVDKALRSRAGAYGGQVGGLSGWVSLAGGQGSWGKAVGATACWGSLGGWVGGVEQAQPAPLTPCSLPYPSRAVERPQAGRGQGQGWGRGQGAGTPPPRSTGITG